MGRTHTKQKREMEENMGELGRWTKSWFLQYQPQFITSVIHTGHTWPCQIIYSISHYMTLQWIIEWWVRGFTWLYANFSCLWRGMEMHFYMGSLLMSLPVVRIEGWSRYHYNGDDVPCEILPACTVLMAGCQIWTFFLAQTRSVTTVLACS